MQVWSEEIWLEHINDESKKLGVENSLLTFDALSAHLPENVEGKLKVPTNGCLYQQTVQADLQEMLDKICIRCSRKIVN